MTRVIIIVGPTGVGKSAFAEELAYQEGGTIINGDMGQLYTPLSIGTAKPDLSRATVPHALFNLISEPRDATAYEYRSYVQQFIATAQEKGPYIIVGGSLFYIQSLLFRSTLPVRPLLSADRHAALLSDNATRAARWQELAALHPAHAAQLHYRDSYRVERFHALPHSLERSAPLYDPLFTRYEIISITRPRSELYDRIDRRVVAMFAAGWVDEVRHLSSDWLDWLRIKKLIGYNEIASALVSAEGKGRGTKSFDRLIPAIQQRTRHYAKRQLTFWRMLRSRLEDRAPGSTRELALPPSVYESSLCQQ